MDKAARGQTGVLDHQGPIGDHSSPLDEDSMQAAARLLREEADAELEEADEDMRPDNNGITPEEVHDSEVLLQRVASDVSVPQRNCSQASSRHLLQEEQRLDSVAELGHLCGRRQARQRSEGAAIRKDAQGAVGDRQCIGQGGGEAARLTEPTYDKAGSIHRRPCDQERWLGYAFRVAGARQHGFAATCQRQLGEDEVHHGLGGCYQATRGRHKVERKFLVSQTDREWG